MKPVIEIRNLSKKFTVRRDEPKYLTLRDSVASFLNGRRRQEEFWALHDITFNIDAGESLAIIGKNGAGKSTLLKVLSRITPPTSGFAKVRGRVASLLEIGTGFHRELTGRENVYLNGSILGLTKQEISARFDRIVDFSGIESFIDMPLKKYSNGMQLRLAFSVAAHLEPDVLMVDEVLAVGDAEYQRKCLTAMAEAIGQGRTVLFVSHNLNAVRKLCRTAIILDEGRLVGAGDAAAMASKYLGELCEKGISPGGNLINILPRGRTGMLTSLEMLCDDRPADAAYMGCDLKLKIGITGKDTIRRPVLGIGVRDQDDQTVLGFNNRNYGQEMGDIGAGRKGTLTLHIPFLQLAAGDYTVDLYLTDGFREMDVVTGALRLQVNEGSPKGMTLSHLKKGANAFFHRDVAWKLEYGS